MEGLGLVITAPLLVGRLEPTEEGAGATRPRWASPGHLPPLLIGPDGAPQVLTARRADLVLGVDPHADRTEQMAVIVHGSTQSLYTDGWSSAGTRPSTTGV
ncbi:SpoIIE family protein phosphatase [Blastococcus colisei]|uniref:SpoIIE family protein phosphatase n=1 Tax=Blastococcus colisei TaxID=1564162 RepID=UPI001FE636A7|nr:SpoIIE family protein phosphatase [Blastococcus colisei]